MKIRSLFGIFCISIATFTAQGGIVYVNGPSFQIPEPWGFGSGDLDLNSDSVADFSFWNYGMICTMDVPTSACSWAFYVGASGANEFLLSDGLPAQSFGTWISSNPDSGAAWSGPGYITVLANMWYDRTGRLINGQVVNGGWDGPLSSMGVGYLAVRFYAADGLHFGWIRIRLPLRTISPNGFPLELLPVVVDWAYETQPNTPIRAGAIGTDSDSVQFKVEFFDLHPRHRQRHRQVGTGSFILTDNNLRGELVLPAKFSSADLRRPANPRSRTKPVWSFGPSLVSRTDRTVFFGETALTRAQIIALAHGLIYVSIDDGDLVGRITPMEDDQKRRR